MENQKVISVNGKELTVKKIPLGKYPRIIESVQGLAKHKDLFSDLSNESIMQALPQILIVATPDVVKVVNVITELPEDEINEWGIDDFVLFLDTLFQVNNFDYVYKTIKKAMSSFKVQQPGTAQVAKLETQNDSHN